MILRRSLALSLPVLMLAACSGPSGRQAQLPAADRFAAALEGADHAAEGAILRMAGFEQVVLREETAVAYATGRRVAPAVPGGRSAAEAAGAVVAPAFTALGDYGFILAAAARGETLAAKPGPSGQELATATEAGLAAVQAAAGVSVAAATRTAGLAGIQALADMAETLAKRGVRRASVQSLAQDAQPHIDAVVAMLRDVLGAQTGQAVRGAIAARRAALAAAHERLLASAQGAGPAARYGLFRSVTDLRDNDPAQGNIAGIVTILERLQAAHQALATDAASADAEAKVTAFEEAVAELTERTQTNRPAQAAPVQAAPAPAR